MDFRYLQPKSQVPDDPKEPWFYPNLIGKNTLHSLLHTMCEEEAGIEDKKSNHSLRASGTTAMFAAQVPEKMIKEETGHKSSKALAIYECPTYAQRQALPKVLACVPESSSRTFSTDIAKLKPMDELDAIVSQLLLDYLYLETNILDFAAVLLLPAYLVFVILP